MKFDVNHPILFLLVGIVIAVVLAQSVYFLVKSVKRAKKIGMDMTKIKVPESLLSRAQAERR